MFERNQIDGLRVSIFIYIYIFLIYFFSYNFHIYINITIINIINKKNFFIIKFY